MSNLTKLLILVFIGLFLASASIWFIGGKKKEYGIIVTLKARPYQLFPYLVEAEQKKKWMSGFLEETVLINPTDDTDSAGTIKENAELETVIEIEGEPIQFRGQVIRFSKNEVASFKYRSDQINQTSFFRLDGKDDVTQLTYKRIVQLDGAKRFMSVFNDDLNQADVEAEISRLTKLIDNEVDNSVSDPDAILTTVGVESGDDGDADLEPRSTADDSGSATDTASQGSGS